MPDLPRRYKAIKFDLDAPEDHQTMYVLELFQEEYTLNFRLFRKEVMTRSMEERPIGEGFLRFDGCLNFSLNNHLCCLNELQATTRAFQVIYQEGGKMPHSTYADAEGLEIQGVRDYQPTPDELDSLGFKKVLDSI